MASNAIDDDPADRTLPPSNPSESRRMRQNSRSPHPYHRRGQNLPGSSDSGQEQGSDGGSPCAVEGSRTDKEGHIAPGHTSQQFQFSSPKSTSESGTEADDEGGGFLKVLPAPSLKPRKGLRGNGTDGTVSPLSTPSTLDVDPRKFLAQEMKIEASKRGPQDEVEKERGRIKDKDTRRKLAEILRRISETGLLGFVGYAVYNGEGVVPGLRDWRSELFCHSVVSVTLYALHPLRLVLRWATSSNRNRTPLFRIPVTFDPAPLLYPLLLPVFVALSLIPFSSVFTLPNLMLSLASLPPRLIPFQSLSPGFNVSHWFLATLPLLVSHNSFSHLDLSKQLALRAEKYTNFEPESLALLFPLHQSLLPTLEFLTTTSLLPAELQLLDIGLINLWLFSRSPQAEILKSVLWIGGLCLFLFCQKVLNWEVALARVPSWRFRRPSQPRGNTWDFFESIRRRSGHMQRNSGAGKSAIESSGSESEVEVPTLRTVMGLKSLRLETSLARGRFLNDHKVPASAIEQSKVRDAFQPNETTSEEVYFNPTRRHTFSTLDQAFQPPKRSKTTPSGRPKRTLSSKTRSLLNLTAFEALIRRWLYAFYTYAMVAVIILVPIRKYVMVGALRDAEPFGWALGYLFGNIPSFRLWVVKSNYERWIPLPTHKDGHSKSACHLGCAEHLRKDTFGEANTRLFICAYCVGVLAVGMAIVFRLSSIVEVDTRRKVFHGMMVAMFLPTTFIDPSFTALALGLVLAIFLMLDLFRASQLPPVSKPLTYFLAPYVDGRDHRGPVIVSHVFLLIGCAIPLWLSLAGIKQIGQKPWEGWDVTLRDVSMVSGVICVGMGDAAASLIGRRFGRRKWLWSGGKSLEGSFAFAAAVTVGLMASRIWLDIGRWPAMGREPWLRTTGKAVVAATTASLTEAVLTGGNDNVIVPLILWLMVRGLGI